MGENWLLCELLLLEEHWEWESTTVLCVNFLDFNGVVGEEEIEAVELLTSIVTVVLPEDFERKNLAVVIKETLKVLVWATTLQLYLVVVLKLS